jgi:hypothetical protein
MATIQTLIHSVSSLHLKNISDPKVYILKDYINIKFSKTQNNSDRKITVC